MTYSVFNNQPDRNHTQKNMFADGEVDIARYDMVKYPWMDKQYEKQIGFFWRPQEVDIEKDKSDFRTLTEAEEFIFTSNLKRQILLDSVQGRAPSLAFLPLASLPELEVFIQAWAFFETIHSRSYSHLIRNVYPDPSVVFDGLRDIAEIVDCANDISKYYDDLIRYGYLYNLFGEGTHTLNGETVEVSTKELKRKLLRALVSVNALEGVRFYVSFACSWAFAEQKKMEGNAKIIKFIARDENLHLGFTHQLIKNIIKDEPEMQAIWEEDLPVYIEIFKNVIEQEKQWGTYLFKKGPMMGMNEALVHSYLDWLGVRRMTAIGLPALVKGTSNPFPWTQKWIAGGEVQVAPQETEISSYIVGGIKRDVGRNTFSDMKL
jgi:ribonucleoside-diphosphate reductase beta chain